MIQAPAFSRTQRIVIAALLALVLASARVLAAEIYDGCQVLVPYSVLWYLNLCWL